MPLFSVAPPFRNAIRAALLLAILLPTTLAAEEGGLIGPAFSDPDLMASKPDFWVNSPITHAGDASQADIAVVLDQHTYPGLLPLVQSYARQNALNISVTEGTCGLSEGMLNRKQIDIGGFCCPPATSDRLPGLRFHTVGITSLAILVHPDNPIETLTVEEVRDIFQGRIRNWSQVADAVNHPTFNQRIKPVARLHCKTRPAHWRLILDNENLFSPLVAEVGTIPDMVATVAADVGAIGHEEVWIAQTANRAQGAVRTIRVNGLSASDPSALETGRYPFFRVHNITTWAPGPAGNPQAQALARYLMAHMDQVDSAFEIVPHDRLRALGWRFQGEDLTGPP